MTKESLSTKVIDQMLNNDPFTRWLGIEVVNNEVGKLTLQMTVRKEMLNGFEIAHGGITYSLADSALAFASNGLGTKSVSIETSISHTKVVEQGDVLTAIAEEKNLTNRFGIYEVVVRNQNLKTVALFKGTVYRTDEKWEV